MSSSRLRVDVVDYSGHPFQVQLSRALAARGHEVRHVHCSDYASGKGRLDVTPDDPPTFTVTGLSAGRDFDRYRASARVRHEIRFGRRLAQLVRRRNPDVVVLCNVPLVAHFIASSLLAMSGPPQVFWLQDIYSRAIRVNLRRRLGWWGRKLGGVAVRLEGRSARNSAAIVAITEDFRAWTRRWGVPDERVTVVPNWAPLTEVVPRPRDNAWAREHNLVDRPVALYSGTLGLKHDPEILLRLARWAARHRPDARVVVVTQGHGRRWLEQHRGPAEDLPQLVLLDFQPYERLSDVLAAADVLVVILEPTASVFSVPSKVLTYLCAERAVLAVMPPENLAARTVRDVGAGVVVPTETVEVEHVFGELLADPEARRRMGRAGRRHAETAFDIEHIASTFEDVLHAVTSPSTPRTTV